MESLIIGDDGAAMLPMELTSSSNSANDGGRTSSLSTITKLPSGNVNGADEDSEVSALGGDVLRKRGLSFADPEKGVWRRIWLETKKVRSIMLLNVITIIYASNIPIVKEVEAVVDPQAFPIVRFSLAALAFSPFVFRARGDVRTRNAGIELGFWVSLGYLMQALGLQTYGAGRASFLTMFTVIVVPLLDGMLGSKIPALTWFGAFMSITGVGMLETSGAPPCIGDLLNFMSAVFFGVHMLSTEHISRSTDKGNFLALLGYQVSVVAFFSTVWYIFGAWSCDPYTFNASSWTLAKLSDWLSLSLGTCNLHWHYLHWFMFMGRVISHVRCFSYRSCNNLWTRACLGCWICMDISWREMGCYWMDWSSACAC